jgi:hypothetical protein
MIRGCRFVHCVPVRISPVAVRLQYIRRSSGVPVMRVPTSARGTRGHQRKYRGGSARVSGAHRRGIISESQSTASYTLEWTFPRATLSKALDAAEGVSVMWEAARWSGW